jgi:hypothetical protein
VICDHALTEFCSCLPRRPVAYVAEHVEMRGPGERLPAWSCQCQVPHYKRHKQESDCIPQADVDAFKAQHGITSDGKARALMFIETFNGR